MPSNLSSSLLLLPSISASESSKESALCTRWPKYWNFSISPSNEYSGLISLRIDWSDFPAAQGTLKNLQKHQIRNFESINSSAFSLLYGPNLTSVYDYWKNHSLDNMDLCQHTLSGFVTAFLLRSKSPLISGLQSLSRVLEPKKMSATVSIFSPSICHEMMVLDAMISVV